MRIDQNTNCLILADIKSAAKTRSLIRGCDQNGSQDDFLRKGRTSRGPNLIWANSVFELLKSGVRVCSCLGVRRRHLPWLILRGLNCGTIGRKRFATWHRRSSQSYRRPDSVGEQIVRIREQFCSQRMGPCHRITPFVEF